MVFTTGLSGHISSGRSSLLLQKTKILWTFSWTDTNFEVWGRGWNIPYIPYKIMSGVLWLAVCGSSMRWIVSDASWLSTFICNCEVLTWWLWWHLQLYMPEHSGKHGNCLSQASHHMGEGMGWSGAVLWALWRPSASHHWDGAFCSWQDGQGCPVGQRLGWAQDTWDTSCQGLIASGKLVHSPTSISLPPSIGKKRLEFSPWKSQLRRNYLSCLKTYLSF